MKSKNKVKPTKRFCVDIRQSTVNGGSKLYYSDKVIEFVSRARPRKVVQCATL